MSDAGGTGGSTDAGNDLVILATKQSTALQFTRQALTLNPEGKGKEDDLETLGATIWKQMRKKLVTHGDRWRYWLRTGVPGVVMLALYVPEGATKALIIPMTNQSIIKVA